jgi:ubiquitin-activating enzyme E1
VIISHQTESYGSSTDPPEKNPPVCLVHSFPHNIEHCLQWAREIIFEGRFVADADVVNKLLTKADYVATLAPNMKRTVLETIREVLVNGQKSLDECVIWARKLFEKVFVSDIQQLIWQFPADFKDPKTGSPFWTGAKRPPTPDFFDPNNELHANFVVAATFLRAWNLNIVSNEFKPADYEQVRKHIISVAAAAKVEPWKPKGPIKIAVEESETAQPAADFGEDDDVVCAAILKELPAFHPPGQTSPKLCNVVDFEKDNDENFHIDLIHAAANIRANQYKIKIVERLQSKLIAGKIIPAIVTTTSSVTGLVCLELYKLLQSPARKIDHFRNTFVNLALPLVQQSEPIPPKKVKFNGKDHSIWDRIDIKEGDLTLQQVLDWIKKNLQVDVDILGVGQSLVYSTFMPAAKRTERLGRKLTAVIEEITKTPLKAGQRHVGIEVTGTINGEDVDVPQLTLWY